VYLNFRYLVAVFYRLDHPLKRRLETLGKLTVGRCIAGYSDVFPLNVVSSESLHTIRFSGVGDHMERALSGVQTCIQRVVLAIRYRVRLVSLLWSLVLCL
jgi:hypothetical protein